MKVYRKLEKFDVKNPVVTIGIFDGVHRGHHKIIDQLKKTAKEFDGESVIFTLWPHPRLILDRQENKIFLLNTIEDKIKLLEKAGIDHLIIQTFDSSFAKVSAGDFIEKILVNKIGIKQLIVGFNHKFGHKRYGGQLEYDQYAAKFGFNIINVEGLKTDNVNISSTRIRSALLKGDIILANKFLGYTFKIQGKVVHGSEFGRTINFPTANIQINNKNIIIPGDGVYAVKIGIGEHMYSAMLNIGKRPTISEQNIRTIEVNIFDFKENIYNKNIDLYFYSKIRNEIRFMGVEELKIQLKKDKIKTKQILSVEISD
ncbi:bifunctional riboflavin kinase/FAD synthetase [Bacteroidota bacterium]